MKKISIILLLTLAASSMQAQRIKGSDTVLPVAQQTAERFMALNPDARITVTVAVPAWAFPLYWTEQRISPWHPAPSSSARK